MTRIESFRSARPSAWHRAAMRLGIAAVGLALAPALAAAQVGGTLGVRVPSGTERDANDSDRTGIEARLTYDRDLTPALGWRAELAYNQMQYQRTADTLRFRVSENGFELGLSLRGELRQGAFSGVYGMVGPIASFRALCGSSGRFDQNGRVVCDAGETSLFGVAAGLGYRWQSSQRRDMSFEVRYLSNVTAAQGGNLLAVSIGVRARKPAPRD